MFCKNCGTQLKDETKFCQTCGTPVSVSETQSNANRDTEQPNQQTQASQSYGGYSYQPQPNQSYAPGAHSYQKLGGYLKFVMIGNYILGGVWLLYIIPIVIGFFNLLKLTSYLGSYAQGLTAFMWYSYVLLVLCMIFGAYISIGFSNRVRKKDPDFLRFIQSALIKFLVVSFPAMIIQMLWAKSFDVYGIMDYSSQIAGVVRVIISGVCSEVFCYFYFGKSVRVRTYMGSDEYLKRSIFNKNSQPVPAVPDYKPENNAYSQNETHKWRCSGCDNMISSYPCPHCGKLN